MVATLLKLRFRLLANTLSREVWRLVFTIIGALYALGIIAVLGIGAFFLGFAGVDLSAPAVAAGVALTVLWVVVPLLAYGRSEEHTSELQSRGHLVCRLLLEKKKLLTAVHRILCLTAQYSALHLFAA